ncbi:Alpha-1,2-mannosyltransferase alg9 [Golovinomyces cichoracearum]|uniref:Mannosyltransferase n=1 Tax=Golovinomyces cichoracearum TaxID=62708 RepID=A0A420HCX8_9PEZI|nr:Alpha-1,2-mannosyltransferase alg9 [Golovinomyces cichoracearum]
MPINSRFQNKRRKVQIKKVNFINSFGIFCVFMVANALAALHAPIHDCDETFNYWEPTHFMSHGYGLQTWEYSPEYAIRSWLYIIIHATIGNIRRILPSTSKVAEFYFIRHVLAFSCAFCQTLMFQAVKNTLNTRIASFLIISMIFSPGMYHASVSFLPSSFSMFTTMLGTAAFMDKRQEVKIPRGITWFSVGGIIGWPFSLVLSFPFLLHEISWAARSRGNAFTQTFWRLKRGISASVLILLFEILVSGIFYRRLAIVPLNIVLYNVISGPGPNIYGTEPWHFYFRNLLLNFNIWFVLAIISLPLHLFPKLRPYVKQPKKGDIRSITLLSPFYLWLLIFSLQPHKEERFMYPLFPFLALNAAMSLHLLLAAFGNINPRSYIGKIPGLMKFFIVVSFFIAFIGAGLARVYGVYSAYSAPLHIYEPLLIEGSKDDFVCFGKDWYRFPSSYHLPRNIHAKFIKSEFRGLIPGEFSEAARKYDIRSGTWLMPSNMNDQNLEDLGKYIEISACDFLVDTYYPARKPSRIEPDYILDSDNWKTIKCLPFLDAVQTSFLGRVFWVPESLPFVPENWQQTWNKKFSRKWGRHCLLKHEKPKKLKR